MEQLKRFSLQYIYILVTSLILILIAIYISENYFEKEISLEFGLRNGDNIQKIAAYELEEGKYYVFLPSYATMENLSVIMPERSRLIINGEKYQDGMNCGGLQIDTEYEMDVMHQLHCSIRFMKSANVATMHIDTNSGKMDYVHKEKSYEEEAKVSLYSKSNEEILNMVKCSVKGRGNYTWQQEKKPYVVMLTEETDLLEMGEATNWILLSNSADQTNLRNAIAYDLAREVDLGWVPEYRYVDLYLNGIYHGLYMLTEKIEEKRLDINTLNGDFLCKVDREEILSNLNNPFRTSNGRIIEITEPQVVETNQKKRIEKLVNELEESILSKGELREGIDWESWAKRYLIDEITANIDADMCSSYFYYKEGIFYAGPVWDYDLGLGVTMRNMVPEAFIAKTYEKKEKKYSLYYDSLYNNEEFYDYIKLLYLTEFEPLINDLIETKLEKYQKDIDAASEMNCVRWANMYEKAHWEKLSVEEANAKLLEYLERRYEFLNGAWIENIPYCTVQMKDLKWDGYWSKSVPKGSRLEETFFDIKNTTWVNEKTGEVFDFNQPIIKDIVLRNQDISVEESKNNTETRATQEYITILSICIGFIMLIGIISIDIQRNKKAGRKQ